MDGGDPAGGSRELVRLIDKHGDALVYDFQTIIGRPLTDLFVDGSGLTPRMAMAYIRNLPHDSATVAEMRGGPEFRGWNPTTHLIADVFDAIKENTYVAVSANSGKKKPKKPERYPRPGDLVQKRNAPNSFIAAARANYKKKR